MELKGRHVSFTLSDIYYPPSPDVAMDLYRGDVLMGEVVDLTDAGTEHHAYAVVRVARLAYPLIIPLSRTTIVARDVASDEPGEPSVER
jgi:hypothetical protein